MNNESPQQRLARVFGLQKLAFNKDPYPSAEQRIERVKRIPVMLRKHREAILGALAADFQGHSRDMGDLIEIIGMFERAEFVAHNVKRLMKPVPKATNPVMLGKSKAWILRQPEDHHQPRFRRAGTDRPAAVRGLLRQPHRLHLHGQPQPAGQLRGGCQAGGGAQAGRTRAGLIFVRWQHR